MIVWHETNIIGEVKDLKEFQVHQDWEHSTGTVVHVCLLECAPNLHSLHLQCLNLWLHLAYPGILNPPGRAISTVVKHTSHMEESINECVSTVKQLKNKLEGYVEGLMDTCIRMGNYAQCLQ